MKRWLVTGAAGFLGSHVVEALLAEKAEVHALDNLSWGHRSFIEANKSKITFHEIDIRDKKSLDEVIKGIQPTHIIHLAALHFIPAAIRDPSLAIDINVLGTQNLLQSLREHSKFEAFWFASTGDVYAPDNKPHHV
jgi:UDP-glucose 4-epimerase